MFFSSYKFDYKKLFPPKKFQFNKQQEIIQQKLNLVPKSDLNWKQVYCYFGNVRTIKIAEKTENFERNKFSRGKLSMLFSVEIQNEAPPIEKRRSLPMFVTMSRNLLRNLFLTLPKFILKEVCVSLLDVIDKINRKFFSNKIFEPYVRFSKELVEKRDDYTLIVKKLGFKPHKEPNGSRGKDNQPIVIQTENYFLLRFPKIISDLNYTKQYCYFFVEGKKITLTIGDARDLNGFYRSAIELTNLSCGGIFNWGVNKQVILDDMEGLQKSKKVKEVICRKPVIYYYGYDVKTTISTAVTLDPRLSFYELIPGFNHVVNINKASWVKLSALPGIGIRLAHRMVNSRPKEGYLQVTDILQINGIGAKTFDAIQPFIGVDDTPNHWVVNQSSKNDGSVIDLKDSNAEYPYLFWEASAPRGVFKFNVDQSFCVKKEVLTSFLTGKLAVLGLNKKESADFIEFWVPLLTGDSFKMYPYVMVEFMEKNYMDLAALDIHPQPDQLIRVFAHFQLLVVPIICGEPELTPVTRMTHGRVVVEWGGTESVPDLIPSIKTSVKALYHAMLTG